MQTDTELPSHCKARQSKIIARALETARTYGIDQLPDQIAYCTLTLSLGAAFHESTDWQPALSEVRAGRQRFTQALHTVLEAATT